MASSRVNFPLCFATFLNQPIVSLVHQAILIRENSLIVQDELVILQVADVLLVRQSTDVRIEQLLLPRPLE